MDRQSFYENCRRDFPDFTYNGYSYQLGPDGIDISYDFEINGLASFNPKWHISKIKESGYDLSPEIIDEMVFSLGMVELVSYWKIACPPNVHILKRKLNDHQIAWWKKLYFKGLGEFYYTNGINENIDDFMTITSPETAIPTADSPVLPYKEPTIGQRPEVLIPVGGGKDSVVTISLLEEKTDRYCYIINSRGATEETVITAGLKDKTIYASRSLDKNMLELNSKGYLNGHTPFSALVAFSTVITGYINGISFVALSNENSANESTVLDSYVNHQYSKSFEFESDFREYEEKYLHSGVYYFSFLRPISELQIAMLFSRFKAYHRVFKSCNVGSKQDIWCGHCPKCLFVYIILSPYLSLNELDAIFNKRLFEDETLMEDFDKLCGILPEKPFECVGSRFEVNAALTYTIGLYEKNGIGLPLLLDHYKKANVEAPSFSSYKTLFLDEHALFDFFKDILYEAITK
ncbi:MAG: hypothetical protein K5773_07660 [Pseudobutyrivibrio sp.]|nr:hypothetical protein [Pseudobutyrivibrio sp.]